MANFFEVVPQTVLVGTATNGLSVTFYYDFTDHSICKMLINQRNGTLANDTLVTFNRKGLATTAAGGTTTIPSIDTGTAIPVELNSGDVADSVVAHGAGFGV